MQGPLILKESANKKREARFMVFSIKLGFVPSPERSFHGEVKEASTRASLEINAPNDVLVIGTWLVFQEKIILE
jgi:hypothetical protein